jgi:hypothetical protein
MTEFSTRANKITMVALGDMAICESAQRDLKPARVAELLADFDCTAMGRLVLSFRDGRYYIIDGQHRKNALAQWIGPGWEGLPIECIVYTDLTEQEEAELFLKLNKVLSVTQYSKFAVAITAKREEETKIKVAVEACGLHISRSKRNGLPGGISAVNALRKVYNLGGSKMLIRSLKLCVESFGDAGLEGEIIEGLGHLFHRYGDAVEEVSPIEALSNIRGGVKGLVNQANTFRLQTGNNKAHCIAAAAVKFINAGRRTKKLPDWWQGCDRLTPRQHAPTRTPTTGLHTRPNVPSHRRIPHSLLYLVALTIHRNMCWSRFFPCMRVSPLCLVYS